MGEQRLRVGMIGAGSWARQHLQAWDANEHAEVVGIWNRTAKRAEVLAKEFNISQVVAEADALIHSDDVDVISISMPHNLHYPFSTAAIDAGKHVFCEKPLAMDLREARDMWRQAESAGVKTGIQFFHRNDPVLMHLRDLIADGYLGSIQYVELKQCFDFGARGNGFPWIWRCSKSIAGTGALGDLGVYLIDMARWLVGEFSRVCGDMKTFVHRRPMISDKYNVHEVVQMAAEKGLPELAETGVVDNDDECNIIVDFDSGAHGYIRASRFHADRGIIICGSRGEVRWNPAEGKLMGKTAGAEEHTEIHVPEMASKPTIVTQFVSNIRNGTNQPPTFFDGLKAQEVIEATSISVEEERWVTLPLAT